MPPPRRVPEVSTTGPFTYRTSTEVIGRGQLRGPRYRRLTRGIYQDVGVARGYAEKIQTMRLLVPHEAVLRGLGAAWAHGVYLARASDPVEFVCAAGRVRTRPGLELHSDTLPSDEIVTTRFGLTTSPIRTAFDLARSASVPRAAVRPLVTRLRQESPGLSRDAPRGLALLGFPEAGRLSGEAPSTVATRLVTIVSQVDAILRAARLGPTALATLVRRHSGMRGLWSARLVLALADPRAESPPESVLRVRIVLAGLPRPEPQYEIYDANGQFVARPDLAWPEYLLGGEYDGAYHDERPQVRRDRKRDVRGHKVKWRLLHLDSSDLRDVPTMIRDVHTVMVQQASRD